MKKLMLSLLTAGALSIPASASALPTQNAFKVTIVNGLAGIPAGEMFFDLDYDVTALPVNLYRGCRYFYEWSSSFLPLSAEGFVIEAKAHAASSCVANAYRAVQSIVQNDPTCISTGFDRFGQFRTLALLSLGESVLDGSLNGLVAFGGAVGISPPSTMYNSISINSY